MNKLTFFLSLIDPFPRTMILQPVSCSSCFVVIPRGPRILPTKLNWKTKAMHIELPITSHHRFFYILFMPRLNDFMSRIVQKGLTYIWKLLDWNINFFWETNACAWCVRQHQRLVLFSVDLKEISSHLTDLWNYKNKRKISDTETLYLCQLKLK